MTVRSHRYENIFERLYLSVKGSFLCLSSKKNRKNAFWSFLNTFQEQICVTPFSCSLFDIDLICSLVLFRVEATGEQILNFLTYLMVLYLFDASLS